jgi:pimeloyl-ACP methyl ester carboxylesterase
MRLRIPVLAALAFACCSLSLQAQTLKQLQLGSPAYNTSYYSNKTVTGTMSAITRVVILQHGINRDGDNAFNEANAALHNSGANIDNTLLVAPQFWNDVDASAGKVPSGTPYWHDEDWSLGFDSMDSRHLSSFTVIDDFVKKFADANQFPNVTQIVVAGHSGGAQMYSRYAAFNTVHGSVRSAILVKYVIANPGTHMYFTPDRATASVATGGTNFAPYTGSCAGFDTYKYGNGAYPSNFSYPHTLGGLDRFKRLATRKTYYYQGSNDTVSYTASNGPDNECGAVLSGNTRLARGVTNHHYQAFLAARYSVVPDSLYRLVEGVGHDAGGMWNSSCAMTALYGTAQMLNTTGAACSDLP